MSDAMPIDLSSIGHLVEPPIIDFLAFEPELQAIVVEFVPERIFSDEQKESVYIRDESGAARRIRELMLELKEVCCLRAPITKLAHGGGGNFSIYLEDDSVFELEETSSPRQTMDAYAVLQTLSQEVQLEFLRQRRAGYRKAM